MRELRNYNNFRSSYKYKGDRRQISINRGKNRLQKLVSSSIGYPCSALCVGADGHFTDDVDEAIWIKRLYRSRRSKIIKTYANKAFRRKTKNSEDKLFRSANRKISEFWYEYT